ncbi:hypothetical protein BJ875DRAFT_446615 [Amylocarpus encephaloides]|uniref:Uncharacterized protein n=1 Tax=Amylocarpus encephaloides TaxID=45428 RepID=A0A9P8BZY6_9HELO|nr:hypothetical protein BJ875DRAFT_446615 [Amylocarpus encephaloides]
MPSFLKGILHLVLKDSKKFRRLHSSGTRRIAEVARSTTTALAKLDHRYLAIPPLFSTEFNSFTIELYHGVTPHDGSEARNLPLRGAASFIISEAYCLITSTSFLTQSRNTNRLTLIHDQTNRMTVFEVVSSILQGLTVQYNYVQHNPTHEIYTETPENILAFLPKVSDEKFKANEPAIPGDCWNVEGHKRGQFDPKDSI